MLERLTLEAGSQASILVMKHVIIHANGIVVVDVALFHHLIGASQDFHNTATVPGGQDNR
jgi:hypothetical protein